MKTKKLVIVRGRGTKNETRIETGVTLYWVERFQKWVSVPGDTPEIDASPATGGRQWTSE